MTTRPAALATVVTAALGAAVGIAFVSPASASIPPPGGGGSSATVNMERLVKAAQWDPRRPGNGITHGSKTSVLRVERALHAKGLLSQAYVDGSFGSKTISAYAAWQRRLGYSGLDATGLPGPTSLKKLGRGRFTVTHVIHVGARTTFSGETVNERTKAMLRAAQRKLGRTIVLSQGSYNPGGVPGSSGTHDGGGVVDVSVRDLSSGQRRHTVKVLRTIGFAAWYRTPDQGNWPYHIHAVAISDTDMSSAAQHQVGDYYEGKDGLADGAPDDGPRVPIHTWEWYQRHH